MFELYVYINSRKVCIKLLARIQKSSLKFKARLDVRVVYIYRGRQHLMHSDLAELNHAFKLTDQKSKAEGALIS